MEQSINNSGIIDNEQISDDSHDKGIGKFIAHMPAAVNYIYAKIKACSDKIQNYRYLKELFYSRLHYKLNLDSPQTYNEKIIWKKINDRNPLLVKTADKYAVRNYIKEVLGEQAADEILVPLYYVTSRPESIPFDSLPEKYVIKPNHGSNMHQMVTCNSRINHAELINKCKKWLNTWYGLYHYEWAYSKVKKKIIIEKLLETEDGELPHDYKFYCFHGKCRVIRVTRNRFGGKPLTGYYNTQWKLLNATIPGQIGNHLFDKPSNLMKMINLAEKLSVHFDYVRVDMYNINGKLFFGELTHYEASGLARFEPESFDYKLGKYWNIKPGYWMESKTAASKMSLFI